MNVSDRYRNAWEGFWRDAPEDPGAVFWDAEPALTAERHLPLFERHFTAGLPVVDLGCGNGTQTRFLAERFPRAVGADLSAEATERARRADPGGGAYEVLDASDVKEAEGLHERLGDANVYMRGVLHQCDPADREPLLRGVAALLGGRGRAFLVELSHAAGLVLRDLAGGPTGPPAKLRPVLEHGIAPGEVADEALPDLIRSAGLRVLDRGELPLTTTDHRPDGTLIELPSLWLLLERAQA